MNTKLIEFGDLRAYQQDIVYSVESRENIGLFLDMGLGKTLITLYSAHLLISKGVIDNVLVVCPPSLQVNVWESELIKFGFNSLYKIKHNNPCITDKNTIYTLSCYQCYKLQDIGERCLLVVDECNYFKNSQSKRFKSLIKHIKKFTRRMILTGTPIGNSYEGVWSQLRLINCTELGDNITEYRDRYFFKMLRYNYISYILKRSMKREIDQVINEQCITINRDECIDMPDVNYIIKKFTVSNKIRKAYKSIRKNFVYDGAKMDGIAEAITKLNQCLSGFIYIIQDGLREAIEIDKTEKLEIIKDMLHSNETENYIIVYRFLHEAYIIRELLDKCKYKYIHYKDKDMVNKWNSKKFRVLLFNSQGSTEGLNLQHGGRNIIWFSLTYSVVDYHQLNARLIRPKQKQTVNIMILQSNNLIDTIIYKSLNEKTNLETDLRAYMLCVQ